MAASSPQALKPMVPADPRRAAVGRPSTCATHPTSASGFMAIGGGAAIGRGAMSRQWTNALAVNMKATTKAFGHGACRPLEHST